MLQYQLAEQPILIMDHFNDLGVLRSPSAQYDNHITSVAVNCHHLCGALLHSFRTRYPQLVWMAFQSYVKPKLMYASQVWSPVTQHSSLTVERIQQRFTKRLNGLTDLPYVSLQNERHVADVTIIHKCIQGKTGYKPHEIGLNLSANNCRSEELRLEQCHHTNQLSNALFQHRATRLWNSLLPGLTETSLLNRLKELLRTYLKT
jgi:hypothetical protein